MGMAFRAGWSIQDVLQAIEWNKEAMLHYPTTEQWAHIFDVEPNVILAAQQHLVATIPETLNASESIAWSVTKSLDAPFHCWSGHVLMSDVSSDIATLPYLENTTHTAGVNFEV